MFLRVVTILAFKQKIMQNKERAIWKPDTCSGLRRDLSLVYGLFSLLTQHAGALRAAPRSHLAMVGELLAAVRSLMCLVSEASAMPGPLQGQDMGHLQRSCQPRSLPLLPPKPVQSLWRSSAPVGVVPAHLDSLPRQYPWGQEPLSIRNGPRLPAPDWRQWMQMAMLAGSS